MLEKCGEGGGESHFTDGLTELARIPRTYVLLRNGSRAGIQSCRGLLTMTSNRPLEARREIAFFAFIQLAQS
jgi:hypothetical protein